MTAAAPHSNANAGSSAANASAPNQLPAWLLTSAGASALLVAFGYLVEVARDELFGITLRDNVTVAEYGVSGARFLVNVLTLAFRLVALHPIVTTLVVISVAAVCLVIGRLLTSNHSRLATSKTDLLQFLAILVLLLGKVAVLDIPPAIIDNILVEETVPDRSFDASPLVNSITQQYWHLMICAHATKAREAGMDCNDRVRARRTLENLFLLNALITFLLTAWTLSTGNLSSATASGGWLRGINSARVLAWLAMLVAVIALPYNYGKLVPLTTFKQVNLYFKAEKDRAQDSTSLPAPVPLSATPATPSDTSSAGTSREELMQAALLLTANANVVTLYYLGDDLIREVSRADIEQIKFRPARDVLQVHMDKTLPAGRKQ